jgi:hypothetical protein
MLNISAYAVNLSPLTIEEIAPPDCIFAGSVFVSRRAMEFSEGMSSPVLPPSHGTYPKIICRETQGFEI